MKSIEIFMIVIWLLRHLLVVLLSINPYKIQALPMVEVIHAVEKTIKQMMLFRSTQYLYVTVFVYSDLYLFVYSGLYLWENLTHIFH